MSFECHAVIFDMDGLLLDTERVYKRAFKGIGEAFGVDANDALYESLVGLNRKDASARLQRAFGSSFPMERFKDAWTTQWTSEISSAGVPIKEGVETLMALLEEHRRPKAVATSSPAQHALELLGQCGLAKRFDTIVTGDEIARGKPAPDIYLEAATRLGVDARHCVALEDSDNGLLAAAAAGMTALMVPDLKPPSPPARLAAYRVLSSLEAGRALIEKRLGPYPMMPKADPGD